MNPNRPTPGELLRTMLEPFEDELDLDLDRELERTLAMSPAEIRSDLEAMGYDVGSLEREAGEFLRRMGWRPRRRTPRLLSIAAPFAAVATLTGVLGPVSSTVTELLPLAAQAPTDPPAVTAAAAPPPSDAEDGGSDDARSR
jgi:hypothetical protein